MKITFKTETDVISENEFTEDNEHNLKLADFLKKLYDEKEMIKYEVIFQDIVKVKDVHYLEDVNHKSIKEIVITIK